MSARGARLPACQSLSDRPIFSGKGSAHGRNATPTVSILKSQKAKQDLWRHQLAELDRLWKKVILR